MLGIEGATIHLDSYARAMDPWIRWSGRRLRELALPSGSLVHGSFGSEMDFEGWEVNCPLGGT